MNGAGEPLAYMLPGVNLFASGTYRGKEWTPAVLRQIVANAKKLGPSGQKLLIPPGVLGHEEDQEWLERTDLPAAGWVDPDTVKLIPDPSYPGEFLIQGDVVNIPPKVKRERFDTGEFRFGSIEIYDDFKDDFGKSYGKAMRRLAFLGGEVPQVKRLGSLPAPVAMTALRQFAERRQGVLIRLRHEAGHTFAEAIAVDRNQLMAAVKAGLPNLSNAFLDKLTDDGLAELVKSVPTPEQPQPQQPQAAPMMPGMQPDPGMMGAMPTAQPTDPSMEFADMSREELVAALTEMGQDPAELEALPDEELQALYDELSAEAAPPEGGGEVAAMGDPASMPREEMIAELAGAGQDPAALEAMPDEELRALYAQVTGGATAAVPAAAPVVPMSERKPRTVTKESHKLLANLTRLNRFAEREGRRLKAASQSNKKRDAESFCEKLISDGKVTPAQSAAFVLPLLLMLDDTTPAHKFSEGGITRRLSAYALKKTQLAKLAPVVRFGERFGSDSPTSTDAETQKVERFAEQTFPDNKVRAEYVAKFKAIAAKKPEFTAREFGVNPVHA